MNFTSAVFAGGGSLLIHCAEAWLSAGHTVRAVVSSRRGIVQWAQTKGIPVFADEASVIRLPDIAFDYLFGIASPCVFPRGLIVRARLLALGFQESLCSSAAVWPAPAWTLMTGETVHGVTWHEMTPASEGRIVRQVSFDIPAGETALSLHARCYEAGLASFNSILEEIGRDALLLAEPIHACRPVGHQQGLQAFSFGNLDFSSSARELASLVGALDFGPYPAPVARAKIYLGDRTLLVRSASVVANASCAAPGTVLRSDEEGILVATREGDILLGGCSASWGEAPGAALVAGTVLPVLGEALRDQLARSAPEVIQGEPFWRKSFATLAPVELPYPQKPRTPQLGPRRLLRARLQPSAQGALTVAGFFAWLSALTAQERISVMYSDDVLDAKAKGLECWLSPCVPLTLYTVPESSAQQATERAAAEIAQTHKAGPCPRDFPSRLGAKATTRQRWEKLGLSLNGTLLPGEVDLFLMADPADRSLQLVADENVFSNETLRAMASHLNGYLKAFQDAASIAEISLLPEEEADLLASINATATPYDAALRIHEAIAAQTERTADRTAVSFRGQHLSYRELDDRATALARRLRARGVRAGDVVGLCLERSPELVVGVLAIMKAGAAYLPLDPEYPHDRLLYMIEDSGAPLVVTNRAVTAVLAIPAEKVFLIDAPEPACLPAPALPASPASAQAQRVAYVIYTSGSTGRPKGVVVTHPNALNFFAGLDARIPHDPPGRWLAVTSLCFDISVVELWWALARGFTIVLHANAAPHTPIADTILQEEVTHLQCTPSMASMLVADTAGRQALSRLSVLMVGGEALSLKLAHELRALVPGSFFNMYGPTETTVWSTACDLADMGHFVPLGQPIANTRLFIQTPGGAQCPALVAGELLIGGAGVSDGYWQRPELNAERFVADPTEPGARLYRTGDLVRRHPDGAFEFLGRIDHQVKIRGHRIELGEIESVLLRQEGVKEAVVIAREDAAGDWSLAAYVTPQANASLDSAQIRRGMAEKLPAIMVPGTVSTLRAFPLTPNGKVDRRALLPARSEAANACAELPQSPLEKTLAAVWEQVLGQSKIASTDNFFALGGSFFLAVQVQRELQKACGRTISLPDMVRFPTLRQLATHLHESAPGTAGRIERDEQERTAAVMPKAEPTAAAQQSLNAVESAMAQIWRDLLGVQEVGLQDDFFALGGHSLKAVRLFVQIRKQFAVDLPLATLLQAPSLAGFSAIVAESREKSVANAPPESAATVSNVIPLGKRPWSPLVPICTGRPDRAPLFCVHGAGGNVLNFKPISTGLGLEQPLYGLQAQGVDGHLPTLSTIQAMAAQYVEAIRSVDPYGPYQLVGYSAGGVIAFEMAQQLKRAGAEIALLGMIDTLSPTAVGRKISFLKKLWLMHHWSLKFIMERSAHRRMSRLKEASYALALEKLSSGESLTPELVEHHMFNHFKVVQKRYKPEPYAGPVVLFKATLQAEMQFLDAGKYLGWDEYVGENVRVVSIASSHFSMMSEPGVLHLIWALKRELARASEAATRLDPARNLPQHGPSLA